MINKNNELDLVKIEIDATTDLLKKLAVILRNSQPEAIGKIRLIYRKVSKNDKYSSFIFNIREKNSPQLGKFQKIFPVEGIIRKLQRRPPFSECHNLAKETLQIIVKLINYRENLIKKESEVTMSINNLLRRNTQTLALNLTKAKRLDDLIYENLESRNLEEHYHQTNL